VGRAILAEATGHEALAARLARPFTFGGRRHAATDRFSADEERRAAMDGGTARRLCSSGSLVDDSQEYSKTSCEQSSATNIREV
jgi:hypothetical protein